jgi:hypothetical protein
MTDWILILGVLGCADCETYRITGFPSQDDCLYFAGKMNADNAGSRGRALHHGVDRAVGGGPPMRVTNTGLLTPASPRSDSSDRLRNS